MTELLPCPFCGGEDIVRMVDGGVLPWVVEQRGDVQGPYYTTCTLYCDACGCELQGYAASNASVVGLYERAIENTYNAWNTRAERTCKNISGKNWWAFECSECGEMIEQGVPEYCPECGAKVVGE